MPEIAFDFDGTLIDCRRRQVAVLRAICPNIGQSGARAIWQLKRDGQTTRHAMATIGFDADRADSIVQQWVALVETPFWLAFDTVQVGVREELARLKHERTTIFLVTARRNGYWLRQQLRQLALTSLIDEICVVDPRNAVEQKAAHLRRLEPALFVGDSEMDARAAARAGIGFVAVGWGQRGPEFLKRCGISDCADNLGDALSRKWRAAG